MKIYKYLTAFMLAAVCSSCNLLEEDPEHILVTDNFYKSADEAVAGVNIIYNRLNTGMYNRIISIMADLPTDDFKNGQGMNNPFLLDLEYWNVTPENQFVGTTWQEHYDGINRANVAINRIPEINMDESLKQRLLGEARFLRALFYFNLVRLYGPVPLVTQDTRNLNNLNLARSPVESVYKLIIEDLEAAAKGLPATSSANNVGRATQGSAKALLGKVYLTRKEWEKAVATLADVVNNEATYKYGLLPNYGDNWRSGTENGQESVFSVQFMQNPGRPNSMMILDAPKNRVPGLNGYEADIPTLDLYNQFSPEDSRRSVTFVTAYEKDGKTYTFPFPLFHKYFDQGNVNNTTQSNANVHVLRYADVLLMYAEALNERSGPITEAYQAINRVRRRAFKDNNHDLSNLSKETFREAVYEERRLEFALEGHRWFDLVRTGRLVSVMQNHLENGPKNIKPFHILMPVPQRERDTNPELSQNEGYN